MLSNHTWYIGAALLSSTHLYDSLFFRSEFISNYISHQDDSSATGLPLLCSTIKGRRPVGSTLLTQEPHVRNACQQVLQA
ncbi:hypothetical protein M378DRAFT_154878 [Amanita muscaria Koide BX008]|uniref:Uncharacterized protein n=1 Tax=Amanita muscaria (strain Koide BX008) TaxID=946122 RepID=A0A0C2XNZ8_AMAMK|nr:hypothetical protein M378DRAFT_154878 [Amanita muscaria Koide BX008]